MHRFRPGVRSCRSPKQSHRFAATVLLAVFAASFSHLPAADAGEIEPALRTALDASRTSDSHSAIFVLNDVVDTDALVQSLRHLRFSRSAQHAVVIDELQSTARATQSEFLDVVRTLQDSGEVSGFTPYWITNAIVVEGSRRALEQLAQHRSVRRVEANRAPKLIEPLDVRLASRTGPAPMRGPVTSEGQAPSAQPGIVAIEVPRVWKELRLNGEGTLVACLDTGVDGAHPALRERWRGHRAEPEESWLSVLDTESSFPFDTHGHGTHVMGTMAGLDPAGGDSVGIAYGAEWIAANAISPQVTAPRFTNAVLASFQWFADPDGDPTSFDDVPDVIQNSWGVSAADGFRLCETSWWSAIDACEAAGAVVTFSAGNSGPIASSLISPADRATTPFKNFSVGAVKATNEEWPFPIAAFSSRGPTQCPQGMAIKPEVVAPGVEVYSSWILPARYAFASGTSMAGPHVAGVVALMRQANPELPVDEVKRILMETARPYGPEDNTYGTGLVDAYAAVLASMAQDGSGRLDGSILGPNEEPVPHAQVRVVETGQSFLTGSNGRFLGFVPTGTHTVEFRHPLLEAQTRTGVNVVESAATDLAIQLEDKTGPLVQTIEVASSLTALDEPVRVRLDLAEYGVIQRAVVRYRRGAEWVPVELVESPERVSLYEAAWDAVAYGDTVAIYIESEDEQGNIAFYPAEGAAGPLVKRVERRVFLDDAENAADWSLASAGDTGFGRWVRTDPIGTFSSGAPVEPSQDRSPAGSQCFVTGKGRADGEPGNSDVDEGCVTLTSPRFDLGGSGEVTLDYWRWFALDGPVRDGSFRVEASSDGGVTWELVEEVDASIPEWTFVSIALDQKIDPGEDTLIRFIACDTGAESLVEAAVDDIELRALPRPQPAEPLPTPVRFSVFPNPMRDTVTLAIPAPSGAEVRIDILDPAGRRLRGIRALADGHDVANVLWDGRDSSGGLVPPGIVFYRIRVPGGTTTGKLLVLR